MDRALVFNPGAGIRKHPFTVSAASLGRFLTFLIQVLAPRSLLPNFGGSGSVWINAHILAARLPQHRAKNKKNAFSTSVKKAL
jgi:hypothetical protein